MKLAPVLVLPLLVAHAHAFDAWGFHSGMSLQQAAAVGQREGYEVREPAALNSWPRFHTFAFVRKEAGSDNKLGYVASFCDGRLTWVSHDYQANIGTMFELLRDLKATYGVPTADTSSNMLTEGRARSIDFNFAPKPDDVLTIAVNLTTNTDAKFGIQVIHHIAEMTCK